MRRFKLVIIGILCALGILVSHASAQSNLTYELKVGTTGENTLLAEFPESYAGEKVNITLRVESLEISTSSSLMNRWLWRIDMTASMPIRTRRMLHGPFGGTDGISRTADNAYWWRMRIIHSRPISMSKWISAAATDGYGLFLQDCY